MEAVEKQLQGTSSASSQPSLTPQMGKKPQMGTHIAQQHQQQQQQIDQQAITPQSGKRMKKTFHRTAIKTPPLHRLIIQAEHILVNRKVGLGGADAKNHKQTRQTSAGTAQAHQVSVKHSKLVFFF